MTCEHVRAQLWTLGLDELDELAPHLAGCPACAALAEAIREETARLSADLDAFADQVPVTAALQRARRTTPAPSAPPARWTMMDGGLHWVATAFAAAAALILGVFSAVPSLRPATEIEAPIEAPLTAGPACADLVALEVLAMTGALPDEAVSCLEARVVAEHDAVPSLRMLAVNAFSAGDFDAWEAYAERLAEADPADPDLAYKLALHLSKQGVDRAEDVVRYVAQALAHRSVWTGDTQANRVASLHKLELAATLSLYEETPEPEAKRRAAEAAKAWLEHLRAVGHDTEAAESICLRVADATFCGE